MIKNSDTNLDEEKLNDSIDTIIFLCSNIDKALRRIRSKTNLPSEIVLSEEQVLLFNEQIDGVGLLLESLLFKQDTSLQVNQQTASKYKYNRTTLIKLRANVTSQIVREIKEKLEESLQIAQTHDKLQLENRKRTSLQYLLPKWWN